MLKHQAISGGPFDSRSVVQIMNGFPRGDKAVDAAFLASMISSLIGDGVVNTNGYDFYVRPDTGLAVRVSPGTAWSGGYMAKSSSEVKFDLAPGHTYTVFIRINMAASEASVMLSADGEGNVPQKNSSVRDLVLAEIRLSSGAESVSAEMITDKRSTGLCGYVSARIPSSAAV